jgi:hypothetical protein
VSDADFFFYTLQTTSTSNFLYVSNFVLLLCTVPWEIYCNILRSVEPPVKWLHCYSLGTSFSCRSKFGVTVEIIISCSPNLAVFCKVFVFNFNRLHIKFCKVRRFILYFLRSPIFLGLYQVSTGGLRVCLPFEIFSHPRARWFSPDLASHTAANAERRTIPFW